MKVLAVVLVCVTLPCLVFSTFPLTCHRCYGTGYCNDGSHEDFINDDRIARCSVNLTSPSDYDIKDPMLAHLQNAINAMTVKDFDDSGIYPATVITTGHCITATVHEPHSSHTLRTCVTRTVANNNTQTLCELIKEIVTPMNWYGGEFVCRACNGSHYCNTHTLQIGDGLAGSSSTMVASCLLGIAAMISIHNLK